MSSKPAGTKKKFGKSERIVPSATEKASRFYPAEDEPKPRTSRKAVRPTKYRKSLQPGTILILLAGRFRGKRVVLLKTLSEGTLLVTGPFKVNGVPLRRVNARYVIATSTKVDLKGVKVDDKFSDPKYFKSSEKVKKTGEEAFFKQGEKAEKKEIAKSRVDDQKAVDKALLENLKKDKEGYTLSYLGSKFSLRKGDRPHEMVF